MGHCRPGTLPVTWRGLLPRSGLLRAGVRRQQLEELRDSRQLARRVPDPSEPYGPGELPLREYSIPSDLATTVIDRFLGCHRKQDRRGGKQEDGMYALGTSTRQRLTGASRYRRSEQ